jgi:hypothetical protein
VYESDPDQLPDSAFIAGSLVLLCPGNDGRMLDPRRTPIRIVRVMPEIGMFELEVRAFEDSGVHWSLPLENVSNFQFGRESHEADAADVSGLEAAVRNFSEDYVVDVDGDAAEKTDKRLDAEIRKSAAWLTVHSEFLSGAEEFRPANSEGPVVLRSELLAYLDSRGLGDIERSFSETWVSNPRSGEIVKAHQIVMARLGLAPFDGQILRDPSSLSGGLDQRHREEHILARIGFVRSVFARLGIDKVVLYRAMTFDRPPTDRRRSTLISATFRQDVAQEWLDTDPLRYTVQLMRQAIRIERVFMTYLETEALNTQYREGEAVIFTEPRGILF